MKPGDELFVDGQWLVVLSAADYDRLLMAAEADGMIDWCETCGAWLDRDDVACAHLEEYRGCWKIASADRDTELCRSYRASDAVAQMRGRRGMERRLAEERRAALSGDKL